ncbi:MAG: acetate kinase [Verrucomicrobia bacterium]|nr:MAG: acetate kinase [Verrucomicrobiota bacterium]
MKIFVVNGGSSSFKCCLYNFEDPPIEFISPVWQGHLQWKNNFEDLSLTVKKKDEADYVEMVKVKDKSLESSLEHLLNFLFLDKSAVISSLNEIDVLGHRIVHGGNIFKESVYITSEVKEKIRYLSELAPLHNLYELEAIEILEKLMGKIPQIAIFDTAFHHTLPEAAKIYSGPYSWYEAGIQRYGFHGINFQYCLRRSAEILKCDVNRLRIVICHLGSGASLCAIKDGKSVDTTMGFTPLEGLMMDTRSGSIDPGIILYFLKKGKKTLEEISNELYNKSGLLGISGFSSDMRDIIREDLNGNLHAKIAMDIYIHRLNACIGSMIATLKGIDVLVFTAGIGENASLVRERVCETFSFLEMKLDKFKNEHLFLADQELSTAGSKVKILLIHAKEEFQIACECWKKMV